ncbi:MAG: PH domain-containing protein [Planctomycetes bacterium]|nr:PH domain-containing protein [Planctomycetota bacterium]
MTSSEGPDGAPAPDAPLPPPLVLADGHLHPGILFLRFLDGIRSSILPLVLGLVTGQAWLLGIAGAGFVFAMVYWFLRFITFRYTLTEDELVTRQGLVFRQERRIPVDRIQDLNFESSLLRRMTGLVVVSVETASSQGAEAKLDSLGQYAAEQLREALHTVRARHGHRVPVGEEGPQETILFRCSATELTLLGFTNNRVGAIFVGVFALWEFSNELGFGDRVVGAGSDLVDRVFSLDTPLLLVVVAAVLFLFLLGGWLLSIAASFVKFHDFTLSVREGVLQRRFGLITRHAQTLPRRKIQRVLLEQTFLRRLLHLVVVRADSAGSGMDAKEEQRSGRDIIAPVTQSRIGEGLVPWLLENLRVDGLEFQRVSAKVVGRVFAEGALGAVVLTALLWFAIGPIAFVALVLVPVAWLFGFLAYRNLGYRELDDHVALRWGILGRYRSFVPLHKVQAAQLQAGPLDRVFGLASLVVYVAGGSPTRLNYLPRDEAERLEYEIAARAAKRRFVW